MDNQNIFYHSLYNEEIYVINGTTKNQPPETSMEVKLPDKSGLVANTLVVVGSDHQEQNDFLSKILGSIGLGKDDFDLLELDHEATPDQQQYIDQHPAKQIIIFGIFSNIHLFEGLEYYVVENKSSHKILMTDKLSDLESDPDKKRKLWKELKILFND
ncbi:MAG: DNA polymerase III subunit psi [Bacteroidetes bacterium]|nr:DNA polymerase III subunit psi [Bacteroidota bacterium]